MRIRLSLAVVLGIALFGSYVYAQFGDKPSVLSTIKIKDDLFVIYNDLVPGNTTVLVTNQGLILVDNKFEIDFDNLMAQIKKISNAADPLRHQHALSRRPQRRESRRCRRRTSRWSRPSGPVGRWSRPISPARPT